jgi:hypothetical protein
MLFDWLTNRAEVTFSGIPDIAAVIAANGVAGYECMVENANSCRTDHERKLLMLLVRPKPGSPSSCSTKC